MLRRFGLLMLMSLLALLVTVTSRVLAYEEAPMLKKIVESGSLPSVDNRLPEDPLVVEPLESIGQYGGTWR